VLGAPLCTSKVTWEACARRPITSRSATFTRLAASAKKKVAGVRLAKAGRQDRTSPHEGLVAGNHNHCTTELLVGGFVDETAAQGVVDGPFRSGEALDQIERRERPDLRIRRVQGDASRSIEFQKRVLRSLYSNRVLASWRIFALPKTDVLANAPSSYVLMFHDAS